MKKLLTFVIALFTCVLTMLSVNAAETYNTTNWTTESASQKINTIGQNVLKKNELPKEVTFNVVESQEVNAYANADNQVVVYTGILSLIENDEELAGILSHEIGHIMKSHCYKQTFLAIALNYATSKVTDEKLALGTQLASSLAATKVSREQEYDADYTSADLIYKAGYNPLGMISVLNKISSNYIDILQDHPSGDKRLMALYDYINYNYPDAVQKGFATNSYSSFLQYAKPTLDERTANKKKNDKYLKTQKKLKEKRAKAAQKMMRTNDPWAMGYSTLKLMSTGSN